MKCKKRECRSNFLVYSLKDHNNWGWSRWKLGSKIDMVSVYIYIYIYLYLYLCLYICILETVTVLAERILKFFLKVLKRKIVLKNITKTFTTSLTFSKWQVSCWNNFLYNTSAGNENLFFVWKCILLLLATAGYLASSANLCSHQHLRPRFVSTLASPSSTVFNSFAN